MATPTPSDKVKDREYTNWLKVTLALYYMKSGLHPFIQSEVDCMHQSLVKQIYAGQTVQQPPCTMCHAGLVKRNKHTRVWKFQNQCKSTCDVWFCELLALHTNPNSEKIYWANSNVSLWPINPWECAKVFLPRGQKPTNTSPAESDAQGLMTLLANCKHFHPKLSQPGQMRTHTISNIRNQVMHNGEMKFSDAERKSFIQEIILLLEDNVHLKSLEDCKAAVSDIHKIDNDFIDAFFNSDLEMTALRAVVEELRQKLGMQEKTYVDNVKSLKGEFRQLTKKVEDIEKKLELHEESTTKRFEDVTKELELHGERVEKHIVKLQEVEEIVETHGGKLGAVEENVEIHGGRFGAIEENVEIHGGRLGAIEENVEMHGGRLGAVEENVEMHGGRFGAIEENVEIHGGRFGAIEENVEIHGGRFGAIEENVEIHGGRFGAIEENVEIHGGRLGAIEENVEIHGGRLGAIEENVEIHGGRLGAIEENVEIHGGRLEIHGERLGAVEENVEIHGGRLGAVEENVDIHGGRLGAIEENVEIHGGRLEIHGERLDAVEENVEIHGERLGAVEENVEIHGGRLGAVEENVEIHGRRLGAVEDNVEIHGGRLGAVEENVEMHGGRLGAVEENVEIHGERLGAVEENVEMHEERLEIHGERLGAVEETVELHGERLEIQGERLDAVEENVKMHGERLEIHGGRLGAVDENVEMHEERLEIHGERLGAVGEIVDMHEERLGAFEQNLVKLQEEFGQWKRENNSCMKGTKGQRRSLYGDQVGPAPKRTTKQQEKLHRSVLNRCQPALLMDLDFKTVSTYIQQKELFDDVTMCDILEHGAPSDKIKGLIKRIKQRGLDTYEKFKECLVLARQEDLKDMLEEEEAEVTRDKEDGPRKTGNGASETPAKRRPESDGLRQLKSQTEDKLDTVRNLGCILTTQAAEAEKLLEETRYVVIKGNPGEGKTTTALHLIDNEKYRDRRVVVYCPSDLKTLDTDWVDVVVLEDILGKYDFDPGYLQELMVYLPTIQEHVDAGKLQVIITTRIDILSKAYSKLGSLKLFSDHLSLVLSSEHLNNSEKMSILNRELQRHKKNMKKDEKEKCIANFSGLIGFPQCCLLFAGDSNLFDKGPEFFKFPEKLFFINIMELQKEIFISLAFLFCHGEIYEEYLSHETMPKSSNDLFMELASRLHVSKEKADIKLLRDAYEFFGGLYIGKSVSYEIIAGVSVKRNCIWFYHATVWEAVGQVLAKHSLEMVVKHADPEYLYRRTYTAEAKDRTSENVFIPVSMYPLMAERMVHNVVNERLVESIVRHSALRQHQFLMKLKDELRKGNRIRDFFEPNPFQELAFFDQYLLKGKCFTFLQCILQNDEDVVKLVYSQFMEFLACTHNKNSSDCWQCKEKQKLLELALYFHHFETADKLTTMNACYTHISLCNAARHGNLSRVQTILEYLKRRRVFKLECKEAKKALCRAYISGNQDVIEILLQEGITLDSKHVVDVVKHGDINVLMKVVEHLKCQGKWYPHQEQYEIEMHHLHTCSEIGFHVPMQTCQISCYKALHITYLNEKFDMADYLVKHEVKVSMNTLSIVSYNVSQQAVARVIQELKVTGSWDPKCEVASKVLKRAYIAQKYGVCDLLVQEGISLTMNHIPYVILRSLNYVKTVVKQLKDTDNWVPKCKDASKALEKAYIEKMYDVCDLLVQEGVSLTMKHIPYVIFRSLDDVKTVVKQLKDTDNWVPKCKDASKALEKAYGAMKYDVCNLLIQEGVSLTMKNLHGVVYNFKLSLETVKKVMQHLKDNDSWNPKCKDASDALEDAYSTQKYDVCDLLVQEGVSLTMKNLHAMVDNFKLSLETVKKTIQHLKDTDNWDPKCEDASKALKLVYIEENFDVCDLLVQAGVSLTMKNLSPVVFQTSLETVKKTIQHLKDTDNWDTKCEDASEALKRAYIAQKYDVCYLLVQEGVSLTTTHIPYLICRSLDDVKTVVKQLKDTDNWDPKCKAASEALKKAYIQHMFDVCDLLVQEGVSLTMNHIPYVIFRSLDDVKTVVKWLKNTDNWVPKCKDALKALQIAYSAQRYDVCDQLVQEGVSLTMKSLCDVVGSFMVSLETVKKTIQHLKDTDSWHSRCDDASKALQKAYIKKKYDVCDLLVQEGVSLTMKNLHAMVDNFKLSLETVKKTIQHLKDTASWDPKCEDASKALKIVYIEENFDVCDLLVQEGVSLTMKHIPYVIMRSLDYVKTVVKQLKDTDIWDPKCEDALKALEKACIEQKYDVFDLLVQEGVSLTMKNLHAMVDNCKLSLETVKKTIQHLKDTASWDPKCEDASKALEKACIEQKYDVFDLLVQEGVSLTMKNLHAMVDNFKVSLKAVKKTIQHLKDTDNWDPKCEDALEALKRAYIEHNYDMCKLLVQEGVSLKIKNLRGVVGSFMVSLKLIIKQFNI